MVKGDFLARTGSDGTRFMPARNFGRRYERAAGGCQGRSVQRLADVANTLLPARVPMQKAAACRQIEYGEADEHG